MSRVFVADELRLKRKVVVKVLSPELAAGVSAERFEREIQLAASLQQANIVPVLSAGDTNGLPYYTMPFVEGESLRAKLSRQGAMPVTQIVGILRDVARALTYAHERGVVHRDIKPDNVLISGGTAVVTDFGIAKALSASRTKGDGLTLTQIGTSIGTPAYMSPEQAAGDPDVDHAADIYAFGCMAYELLSGRPPFHARTPQRVLAAHMNEKPQPVSELRLDTPASLAALVMRCLEKDASARPATAADLVHMLESVTSTGGEIPVMPAILLGGPRMMKRALLVYAVAFAVIAIVAKASIVAIGLPTWVFPGAIGVMVLGLPVILFTGYVHYATQRALTLTPTLTPGGTPTAQGTMATIAVKASPHMSWRRTTVGGMIAVGVFVALVAVYMVLRALGIGPAGSLMAAGRLGQRAPLLIADFDVVGADSTLGDVVTEAVRANLSESGALSIASPSNVASALQRMQRQPTERITLALAREIAVREGMKAIVHGDITSLSGSGGFAVSVRLIPADSGNDLTSFRTTVDGPKDLIKAADELSKKLRGKIGESLKTVQGSPPLEQVTTASTEALRKYSAGTRANDIEQNYPKAVGLLKEAVALDTGFAMAWRKLAVATSNASFPTAQRDSAIVKAMRFQDRLSENEKDLTRAFYYSNGPGRDRSKSIAAYEALLERGDSSSAILNNLAIDLIGRREFARAESLLAVSIASGRATAQAFANIGDIQIDQGKFREAQASIALAKTRFPASLEPPREAVDVLYFLGDLDAYQRALDTTRASRSPEVRGWGTSRSANMALLHGRLTEFMKLSAEVRAIDSARGVRLGAPDSALAATLDIVVRGNSERARQSIAVSKPVRPYFPVATQYAWLGMPAEARAVLAQREATVKDTSLLRVQEPGLHGVLGEIALAEKRPRDAIVEFRKADMRPDGPVNACSICTYFSLGRAFDQADEPDSAIVYFERYVKTPVANRFSGLNNDPMLLAGIYKRLAELYDAKNDRANAMSYYAKFVDLWKNADADLQPKVKAARDRLAALQRAGG